MPVPSATSEEGGPVRLSLIGEGDASVSAMGIDGAIVSATGV